MSSPRQSELLQLGEIAADAGSRSASGGYQFFHGRAAISQQKLHYLFSTFISFCRHTLGLLNYMDFVLRVEYSPKSRPVPRQNPIWVQNGCDSRIGRDLEKELPLERDMPAPKGILFDSSIVPPY